MNPEFFRRRLLKAAQAQEPSEAVPYGFEQRIMRRIRNRHRRRSADGWNFWQRNLWRAFAPCFGMMLAAAVGYWQSPAASEPWLHDMQSVLLVELDLPADLP